MSSQPGKSSPSKSPFLSSDFLVVFTLVAGGFMALGLFAILVYALQDIHKFLSVSMTALLVASASLALGLLVGFIFGIPLSPRSETPETPPPEPENAEGETRQPVKSAMPELYRPNTSMEKISEWLATILVGIGLTQLLKIPSALDSFGTRLKPALGNTDAAPWVAIGILLLYTIIGFLIGFLWTRIKIPELYALSDIRQKLTAAREQGKEAGISQGELTVLQAWAEEEARRKAATEAQAAPAALHVPTAEEPSSAEPVEEGAEPAEEEEREAKTPTGVEAAPPAPVIIPLPTGPARPAQAAPQPLRVLWVDEHPENNTSLMEVMSSKMQVSFEISTSTKDALARINPTYSLVISDLSRPPDRRAGLTLLRNLRKNGLTTPYLIYCGKVDPGLEAEALKLGATGVTSSPMQLISMVEQTLMA